MTSDCQDRVAPSRPSHCTRSDNAEFESAPANSSTGCRARPMVVTVFEKRSFVFSTLGGGSQLYVVLCPALPVLDYSRVKLAIRIHALTMSAGQLLRVYAWGTLPSEEDPAQDFVDSTEFLSVDITSSITAPALVTSRATYDPDAFLKFSLQATQTSAPTTFMATLSGCVQLRDS